MERIVKERKRSGRVEYFVKWKAGDTTWEPFEHVEGTEALDAYMSASSSKAKTPPGRGSPAGAASSSSSSAAAAAASAAKGKGGPRALWPTELLTLRASQLIEALRDEGWLAAAQEAAREAKQKRRASGSKAAKGAGDSAPDEFADAGAALKAKWCTWERDDGRGTDAARLWVAKPPAAAPAAGLAVAEPAAAIPAAALPPPPALDSALPPPPALEEPMAVDE